MQKQQRVCRSIVRNLGIAATAFCLFLGCSDNGQNNNNDGGNGSDGGSGDDGGGNADLYVGPSALDVLAGTLGGPGNADHPGIFARFEAAKGVAMDNAGNLFITDNITNNSIRKMVTSTGAVSTVGGRYMPANLLDVVADQSGNVYFTAGSLSAAIVGKLTLSTGAYSIVAGGNMHGSADGVGAAASFDGVWGLTSDNAGNLFVVDENNATIRQIQLSTGMVTTLAGTAGMTGTTDGVGAAARFNQPHSITFDNNGNLYVVEASGSIRKIVVSSATVSTVGTISSSANDMTWDGAGNLYLASATKIFKVPVATGVASAIAGNGLGSTMPVDGVGAAARFYNAWGLCWDGNGNLYVADYLIVRKVVVATGEVSTVAGAIPHSGFTDGTGAQARFTQPGGVASDGGGNLYIADSYNHAIRKLVVATGAVTTPAGNGTIGSADGTGVTARFYYPKGVVADGAGNVYVADNQNHTIRKLVAASGVVTTLAGGAGIQASNDGTGTAARFNHPSGVALDGNGSLYVADATNSTIRKIDLASGAVTTLAGTAGMNGFTDGIGPAARFFSPVDLTYDGSGNLYVADAVARTVRKVVIATAQVSTIAGGAIGYLDGIGNMARFDYPQFIASDRAGHLFISDVGLNQVVRKIDLSNNMVSTALGVKGSVGVYLAPLPSGINEPQGLAWLPGQGLAVADRVESAILLAHGL